MGKERKSKDTTTKKTSPTLKQNLFVRKLIRILEVT